MFRKNDNYLANLLKLIIKIVLAVSYEAFNDNMKTM
jgi:hypothetical protein